ncbi:uncharacterized protein FFB20_02400 [Fusarium fujikuroi]|nr:uncharacterized protein FFB20_02400 [Fusarium fujikuroi]SCN81942.1 uncharacterized protein FFE2_04861 [Fusarium fujikuroi]SCN84583.1 uncharacterized protein FFM5_03401 [Fusarium fujikuroi]SCO34338.1 uncharacterized protein FFNC_03770 [Fusarium fujikuroi]SCO48893.1 uncharacterized protein FFMR_09384 [Fusarium fujikuroi]
MARQSAWHYGGYGIACPNTGCAG